MSPFLPRERLHLPEFSGKPRCICSEIPKELLPLNPETFHEKLWVQAWVIFLCLKGYVWKNKQSRASPSKNICRTLHVKSTTIQQNMTSRNWKTRRQTWQIFVSFCSYSSCKPNNVIVFEYVMSDRGSICEGPGFWGEEEEVCITLTSGAAAPAVPPYPSRLIRPVILTFVAFSPRCLSLLTTHLSPVKPTEAQKLLTAAPPHLWCCYGFQRFLYDYFGHFILI